MSQSTTSQELQEKTRGTWESIENFKNASKAKIQTHKNEIKAHNNELEVLNDKMEKLLVIRERLKIAQLLTFLTENPKKCYLLCHNYPDHHLLNKKKTDEYGRSYCTDFKKSKPIALYAPYDPSIDNKYLREVLDHHFYPPEMYTPEEKSHYYPRIEITRINTSFKDPCNVNYIESYYNMYSCELGNIKCITKLEYNEQPPIDTREKMKKYDKYYKFFCNEEEWRESLIIQSKAKLNSRVFDSVKPLEHSLYDVCYSEPATLLVWREKPESEKGISKDTTKDAIKDVSSSPPDKKRIKKSLDHD